MDNLTDLLSGTKISGQHLYFQLAKDDIHVLAKLFCDYKEYDNSSLRLIYNIKYMEADLYQLNIVIQYIITYGLKLFETYISGMKIDSYNKTDYEQYINEYIEELSSFIR
jgi:hypothetical protein